MRPLLARMLREDFQIRMQTSFPSFRPVKGKGLRAGERIFRDRIGNCSCFVHMALAKIFVDAFDVLLCCTSLPQFPETLLADHPTPSAMPARQVCYVPLKAVAGLKYSYPAWNLEPSASMSLQELFADPDAIFRKMPIEEAQTLLKQYLDEVFALLKSHGLPYMVRIAATL